MAMYGLLGHVHTYTLLLPLHVMHVGPTIRLDVQVTYRGSGVYRGYAPFVHPAMKASMQAYALSQDAYRPVVEDMLSWCLHDPAQRCAICV